MAYKAHDGYPSPIGHKIVSFGDYFGPASYQQGGYNETPTAYGISRFEWFDISLRSQSANYYAIPFYPATSNNSEARATGFATILVKWYYAANSVEVANNTNLAGECCQLNVRGI